jgi:hypothetical protein
MTIEHRMIFAVSDVLAIRMECARCHAAVSCKLDQTISVPDECPGCHQTWRDRAFPQAENQVLERLISAIKAMREVEHASGMRYGLRLEFDAPRILGLTHPDPR